MQCRLTDELTIELKESIRSAMRGRCICVNSCYCSNDRLIVNVAGVRPGDTDVSRLIYEAAARALGGDVPTIEVHAE